MMVWALRMAGIEHLIHYLNDFLFLVAPQTNEGTRIHSLALNVFARLGVPVALHKTEGPPCVITLLGICIDTIAVELRLPLDKLQCLQRLIEVWAKKKASTKKENLSSATSVMQLPLCVRGALSLESCSDCYMV